MSKQAEEAALKAYPTQDMYSSLLDGSNRLKREVFIKGYEQAEKDLALTWKDMRTIIHILSDSDWYDFEINGKLWSKDFYEEVLKRFKEAKK